MYLPVPGLASPVPASTTNSSAPIPVNGATRGAAMVASDHAGTLQVQRYYDAAGTIPAGALITQAVVAGTPNAVPWNDGLPIGSVIVSFANGAGAVANLTNLQIITAP